jgi:dihydroorotase
MRFPGLVDVHVHLRVPGGEHKEDFRTGTAAALAGGFTTLLAMPNTQPPLVTLNNWRIAQTQAQKESLCDVFLYAGASSEHIHELPALAEHAPALKVYMDATYGPLQVQGLSNLARIMQTWPANKVVALHAEGDSVAIGIAMAAIYQRPVHFCHISRKDEIELIADAKARGLPVTCEVTPHHLFLTQADAARLGALADMRPHLAAQSDVDALWQHLNTTIDCIASDHAPHTLSEKGMEMVSINHKDNVGARHAVPQPAPPGVPGLESTLPLMLTAASEERLTYTRLLDLLYTNPRRIYNLPVQPHTYIEVDEKASYTFPDHPLYTKCGWSPFKDWRMTGRLVRVMFKGKEVFKDGQVLSYKP